MSLTAYKLCLFTLIYGLLFGCFQSCLQNANYASWQREMNVLKSVRSQMAHQQQTSVIKSQIWTMIDLSNDLVACGLNDNSVRIINLNSNHVELVLNGHGQPVISLAALPDKTLASGSFDFTINMWDLNANGSLIRILKGHTHIVSSLAYIGNGFLASASYDKSIRIWNIGTGKPEKVMRNAHLDGILALASLKNHKLASGAFDKVIRIWDAIEGKLIQEFTSHNGEIFSLALMSNSFLASGSADRTIKIWDLKSKTELTSLQSDSIHAVSSLLALPSRMTTQQIEHIVSVAGDTIYIWNLQSKSVIQSHKCDSGDINSLILLKNGSLLIASKDEKLRIWNPLT